MANVIPEKSVNFKVYLNGDDLLGIAEGNFPTGEFMSTEIKGAGLAGSITAPVTGHFQDITTTLTWRTVTSSFVKLATPDAHTMDLYADLEGFDAGRGIVTRTGLHVFMKSRTTKIDLGKLAVGETQDTQTEHNVYYMKVYLGDKEVMEIDKYNFIYKVNGVDYLSDTRKNLGMN